jgi:hypothetical protein
VVRRYEVYAETDYVVRQPDGRPLAVPEWMTRPEAAEAKVVAAARLPIAALLALRRETLTSLSFCEQIVQEENPDVPTKDLTPAAAVRRGSPRPRRRLSASGEGTTAPGVDAFDAVLRGLDAQGGRR